MANLLVANLNQFSSDLGIPSESQPLCGLV
jgi:hypothetical protein